MQATATYVLEQRILGPRKQLSIAEGEFLAIGEARLVLSEALEFEQRYELLVGSFIAMEDGPRGALSTFKPSSRNMPMPTLQKSSRRRTDTSSTYLPRARSYIDQVKQDFKTLPLTPTFTETASGLLSQEITTALSNTDSWRLCAIHTQHRAFPGDEVFRCGGSGLRRKRLGRELDHQRQEG
jgi:hypothetical protein